AERASSSPNLQIAHLPYSSLTAWSAVRVYFQYTLVGWVTRTSRLLAADLYGVTHRNTTM
ncbi:MAG: hypothetical protein QOD29_620, partial [Alphaproteobacteria bacterium]|nr:hypothetical protein [Alphaproteobacteria bacterium]